MNRIVGLIALLSSLAVRSQSADLSVIERSAQRVVKLYGAGGVGRAHGYGTAVLISPKGHLLTVLGSMLEATEVRAVLWDGRRFPAKLLAVDPRRSTAVLKIDVENVPFFDVSAATVESGEIVYALSNQFNIAAGAESVSIQRGVVAAVAPLADSSTPSLILDATVCNPGASGGAVVDGAGRLIGLLAKDYRDPSTRTWVHTAIPIGQLEDFCRAVVAGKVENLSLSNAPPVDAAKRGSKATDLRGLIMLPNVLDQTPTFIDGTEHDSPAEKAGLRSDDLILYVGSKLVQSLADMEKAAAALPADKPWTLIVLRGEAMQTIELPPRPVAAANPKKDSP